MLFLLTAATSVGSILRKVTLVSGCGNPLEKRILPHGGASFPLFFPPALKSHQRSPATIRKEVSNRVNGDSFLTAGRAYQRCARITIAYYCKMQPGARLENLLLGAGDVALSFQSPGHVVYAVRVSESVTCKVAR